MLRNNRVIPERQEPLSMKMDVSRKEATISGFKVTAKNEFKFDILIYIYIFKGSFPIIYKKKKHFFQFTRHIRSYILEIIGLPVNATEHLPNWKCHFYFYLSHHYRHHNAVRNQAGTIKCFLLTIS